MDRLARPGRPAGGGAVDSRSTTHGSNRIASVGRVALPSTSPINRLAASRPISTVGLILLYSTFTLAWVIWIMVGYVESLPTELEDAARVDGCSRLRALVSVILPLSLPGLVATGALAFLNAWNEFLLALIFTNSLNAKTVPVVISEFSTQFGLEYGMMMAGGVLASLPPVILALLFQRYIVSGLASGGVKG